MRNKILKNIFSPGFLLTACCVLCFVTLLLVARSAHAQNFANFIPGEDKPKPANFQDPLSVKEVETILSAEGILNETTEESNLQSQVLVTEIGEYTLGPNDIFEVTVLRHPEVSGEYIVNSEGKIQYEFVGDVAVAGRTKKEVVAVLSEALSKYIISPEVSVKITGYNSKVVYVIGEVASPGKIFMRGDTITVREALIQAGLPLLSAKSEKSKLITPAANGKPENQPVNVYKLLYEGDLRENYVMKPGDTLYIPATFMAKALRVIQPIAAPIGTAAGTGRTVVAPY